MCHTSGSGDGRDWMRPLPFVPAAMQRCRSSGSCGRRHGGGRGCITRRAKTTIGCALRAPSGPLPPKWMAGRAARRRQRCRRCSKLIQHALDGAVNHTRFVLQQLRTHSVHHFVWWPRAKLSSIAQLRCAITVVCLAWRQRKAAEQRDQMSLKVRAIRLHLCRRRQLLLLRPSPPSRQELFTFCTYRTR